MTDHVADRFVWAAQMLDVAPSERLLELGCGQGVAVSLICESLSDGPITAIDRSKSMIDQATRRNRVHIGRGRAIFVALALQDAAMIGERFDKAFAINVRLFRTDAAREAECSSAS
ncbi:MAG: class I SAM-dependent methyltransferase [Gaiellaceae bacterium]